MKKLFVLLLMCCLGVGAQAVLVVDLVDDFSGDLSAYTSTVILDNNGGGFNTAAWQISGGVLQLNTTVYDGIEQYAMIRNGLSLPVNRELQVDISRTSDSQDIGLYVGGTTPVTGTRQDYVAVYARNNGQVFSRGFDGTTEYALAGGATPAALEKLFIARTDVNTFEAGYYDNGVRTIITTRTPSFANEADVVGFYADVRAVGVNGDADNLSTAYEAITNDSPVNDATLIPVARTAAENDLVFTVYDPNIVEVDVYLTAGDPNAPDAIVTGLAIGADGHSEVTKTVTLETELGSDLSFETDYYWKVIGYEPNYLIPANGNDVAVEGPVSHFTTAPEAPLITSDVSPAYTAVDAGEPNIVLTADGINGDFQWYKDGSPIADAAGVYGGTTTNQLEIFDVQLADEGYYTLKVSSLVGDDESAAGRVMIHRQTSYYDFGSTSFVDGNDVFVDSIDGYHAVLSQESASAGLPTSVTDTNSISGLGAYLYLNNEDHATDPNGQYLQIYPGVVDYEDITISLWVHPLGGNEWQRIYDFGSGTPDYLFLSPDAGGDGGLRYATRINNGGEQQLNRSWLQSDSWYFVAVTVGGDTGKMYVNGEWAATNTSMTIDPIDVGAVLNYIGNSQYDVDPEFNGYIDDLKIYNYGRTNEQIAQDYMAVSGDSYVCDTENNDVWRYDQGWEADGEWIGGNNNCKIDLPDLAGLAKRWLEADQFYPAP